MTWHPPQHNIIVPLIEVRYLADNLSCEWVVGRVRKKTVYGTKGIRAYQKVSAVLMTDVQKRSFRLYRRCCDCLAGV